MKFLRKIGNAWRSLIARIRGRDRLTVRSMERVQFADGDGMLMFDCSEPFDTGGK